MFSPFPYPLTSSNLFFSELVEFLQPLIMGGASLAIFYHPLNDNCRFLTFMNDIPDEEFVSGMKYVLLDASIQLVMSLVLITFLRRKLRIDVFRVGAYTLKRTPLCFWYTSLAGCIFFLSIYLQHLGSDDTFKFPWLAANVTNYIPEDAVSGVCQLFNIENATSSSGEECGWEECEDKFPCDGPV